MKTRAITGFIFAAVVLALVLINGNTFTALFTIVTVLCTAEFYKLVKTGDVKPQVISGMLLMLSIIIPLINHFLGGQSLDNLLFCVPFVLLVIISELYRNQNNPFHNIAYTILGVVYAAVPFCFFYALAFRDGQYTFHYPLGFFLMLWSSDTGAYLFGITLGKHRLFERHSPKKSWEGFAGGLLCSMLTAFILSIYFSELLLVHWLVIGAIIAIAGTLGDLSESMLKRSLSTKDSGSFLPGHGGFLDRFDGLLLAAPLVFVYLHLIEINF
jgi:phosphatidate cytidylyltransferase